VIVKAKDMEPGHVLLTRDPMAQLTSGPKAQLSGDLVRCLIHQVASEY
jgi:hypothetical protein